MFSFEVLVFLSFLFSWLSSCSRFSSFWYHLDFWVLPQFYILFIRSLLEQSATVWHSSLSQQNVNDLERVQKSAMKIILGNKYTGYKKSLLKLDILSLSESREQLCLQFALKCTRNSRTKNMFPENKKMHEMFLRKGKKYLV